MIGVYGFDSSGNKKCISSNFVCFEVKKGAYSGDYSMPKDIWETYQLTIVNYVNRAEEAQAHGPKIGENGNWLLWDVATSTYKDTGINASGGGGSNGTSDFIITANLAYNDADIDADPIIENVSANFVEIKEAYDAGKNVVLKVTYLGHAEVTAPMMSISEAEAYFVLAQSVLPHLAEVVIRDGEEATLFVTRFVRAEEAEQALNELWEQMRALPTKPYVEEQITEALKGISSTSASDTTPLMDGTASAGQDTAYARGDHRHPTDTTRVSVSTFNQYKNDLASYLSDEFESIGRTFALKSEVEDLASTDYVDNSIGDVETALENIIKKYGLGGDAQ